MFRSFLVTAIGSIVLASSTGCVSVKTPDTNVKVGITELKMPGSHESDTAATPYARPLRKVSEQQAKVARQLGKRDWEDVGEESAKWLSQVRELAGYAGTSHNPTLFRECCRQLQEQIHLVQQAAERRDVDRIQQAFDACNPPLTTLVQNFPLTRQTTVASPAPQQPTAPAPTGRPVQTVP
jgi:hypothetical protein